MLVYLFKSFPLPFLSMESEKNSYVQIRPRLSIIIPVRNDEGSILPLIEQIHSVLSRHGITYEIVFIDDFSRDKTIDIIQYVSKHYPVSVRVKKGEIGKTQSLVEGFLYAQYEVICTLDASLQYPVEVIPEMLAMVLSRSVDIVIANRQKTYTSRTRKLFETACSFFFTRILHNLDCDVQSGLKIFRKEILERISLNPDPWIYDLEFLIRARNSGYRITSMNVCFDEIEKHQSKRTILKESMKLGLAAIKESLKDSEVVPFPKDQTQKEGQGFYFNGKKFIHYTKLSELESAFYRVTKDQALIIVAICIIFFVQVLRYWYETIVFALFVVSFLYFCDLFFNFFVIFRSFSKHSEITISPDELMNSSTMQWPTYTIFCPLYKEWQVLPQFVAAIHRIEYPVEKLQVLLLLEETDKETIEKAYTYRLPENFQIILVPHSLPKTKPKALNYGLFYAAGEYSVVYDAEDVPDPLQLKKAVLAFKKTNANIGCVQAKLNFYNSHQNLLTKLFTCEYSLWFDLILPGLQSIEAPIPLGGTSNHFKTNTLRDLNGWDSFNVTEDCDLGIRLVKHGYTTVIVNSTTLEEANSNLVNWFFQRTRWIKGYIQTYFVHMRNPQAFGKNLKKPHVLTFQFIVGGKILSMFLNPFLWAMTLIYFLFRPHVGGIIESFFPPVVLYLGVFSCIFGNFLYLYYYMVGAARKGQFELIKYAFLVPFYWLGMSFAAWSAMYSMFISPYYWAKTIHGFHLKNKQACSQATATIGAELVAV